VEHVDVAVDVAGGEILVEIANIKSMCCFFSGDRWSGWCHACVLRK